MQQNREVISQWSESARYWEKHREIIREMFAPVTQALNKDAEIKPPRRPRSPRARVNQP
jgi:hypothetical protein